MTALRRPNFAVPARKPGITRKSLTVEERQEVLDAFDLFDIVRVADGRDALTAKMSNTSKADRTHLGPTNRLINSARDAMKHLYPGLSRRGGKGGSATMSSK